MTQTAATTATIDWGLVVAIGGLCINLVFNLVNFRRTTSLKKRDLRVEEFKRLRTRLDASLEELLSEARTMNALSRSATTGAPWKKSLEASNKKLTDVDTKLRAIARELNSSPFCTGRNWDSIGADDWDEALLHLNGGYNTTLSGDDRKASVGKTARHLEKRVQAYNDRVNAEMARYAALA